MVEKEDIATTLRGIKKELHSMMNGVISSSLREKGLNYKVIFGTEIPRLQSFSKTLPHTYELAAALWKENIRECKLLAGMIMPPHLFDAELAEIWIEQMHYTEEAEMTVMSLFCHTSWASQKAFEWIASEEKLHQLCGYLLFCRLFMQGMKPSQRDANEFVDQAKADILCKNPIIQRAANKALLKYEESVCNE